MARPARVDPRRHPGCGWALSVGLIALPYYRVSNPLLARISWHAIDQALADHQCAS
ncbi:MAG: hypothetical protein ACRDTA_05780 [Pseudonocardiaceae bacterium]